MKQAVILRNPVNKTEVTANAVSTGTRSPAQRVRDEQLAAASPTKSVIYLKSLGLDVEPKPTFSNDQLIIFKVIGKFRQSDMFGIGRGVTQILKVKPEDGGRTLRWLLNDNRIVGLSLDKSTGILSASLSQRAKGEEAQIANLELSVQKYKETAVKADVGMARTYLESLGLKIGNPFQSTETHEEISFNVLTTFSVAKKMVTKQLVKQFGGNQIMSDARYTNETAWSLDDDPNATDRVLTLWVTSKRQVVCTLSNKG